MVVVSFKFYSPSKRLVTNPPVYFLPPPPPPLNKDTAEPIPFHCILLSIKHISTVLSSDIYNLARYLGQASPPRGVA